MIRLIIAEDNRLQSTGISSLLAREKDIEIVGVAHDGQQAIDLVREHCPDIAVLDIRMPVLDGLAALDQMRHDCPHTRVLILTGNIDKAALTKAFQQGALGFVSKWDTFTELVPAVHAVHSGQRYASASVLSEFPFAARTGVGPEPDASASP